MAWTTLRLSLRLIYRRIGILLAGNLLWIVASLTVIGLPAATGGLFYLVHLVIKEERDGDVHEAQTGDFWAGMRRYGLRSTLLWLLDLATMFILFVTLRFYLFHPLEVLRWLTGPVLVILFVALAMQLYLFPLLIVSPELSLGSITRRAFILVLLEPLETFMMLIWLMLLTALCIALAGPVLLLLFSALAIIQSLMLRTIRIDLGEIPASIPED